MKQAFDITGMTCAACKTRVEKATASVDGVAEVAVNLLKNSMEVTYADESPDAVARVNAAISAAVDKAGYGAEPRAAAGEGAQSATQGGVSAAKAAREAANKKAAENRASRNLDTLQDEITGQQIQNDVTSMQIALQKYQKDFADSTLKAPISGTVTAVYAKEGAPAGGLMFVVEDTDSLVIKTKLKEYDIASVEVGMPVVIKSDATGEQEFMGHISHISPAAVKSSTGEIQTEGSVEFDAEITLDEQDTGLRVGMNTRMTIETERKDQVWAVPFDAVTTDAQGQDIVYVARTDENGVTTAAPVPVTTGMETDFYIEVNSDQLNAGDLIISDPGTVVPGVPITLANGVTAEAAAVQTVSEEPSQAGESSAPMADTDTADASSDASEAASAASASDESAGGQADSSSAASASQGGLTDGT